MRNTQLTRRTLAGVVLLTLLVVAVGSVGFVAADTGSDGTVESIAAPESIEPGENFSVTVETAASAGTVIELESTATVEITASETPRDTASTPTDTRFESHDTTAGDSTAEISVEVRNASEGDTIDVEVWVDSEVQSDADDVGTTTVSVEADDDDSGNSGGSSGGGGGGSTAGDASPNIQSTWQSGLEESAVETGEQLDGTLEIRNAGNALTREPVVVKANETVIFENEERLTIGAERTYEFDHEFTDPGEYEIVAESETLGTEALGTVTVTGEPVAEEPSTPESDDGADDTTSSTSGSTGSTIAVLGVLALLVVLGGGIAVFRCYS